MIIWHEANANMITTMIAIKACLNYEGKIYYQHIIHDNKTIYSYDDFIDVSFSSIIMYHIRVYIINQGFIFPHTVSIWNDMK